MNSAAEAVVLTSRATGPSLPAASPGSSCWTTRRPRLRLSTYVVTSRDAALKTRDGGRSPGRPASALTHERERRHHGRTLKQRAVRARERVAAGTTRPPRSPGRAHVAVRWCLDRDRRHRGGARAHRPVQRATGCARPGLPGSRCSWCGRCSGPAWSVSPVASCSGWGRDRGLVRYWWVAVKLALNLILCTLILVALRPSMSNVRALAKTCLRAAPVRWTCPSSSSTGRLPDRVDRGHGAGRGQALGPYAAYPRSPLQWSPAQRG